MHDGTKGISEWRLEKKLVLLWITITCVFVFLPNSSMACRTCGLVELWKGAGRNIDAPTPRVEPTPAPTIRQFNESVRLQNQASHAWNSPNRAVEWRSRGVNNPADLQRHISDVRNNTDMSHQLSTDRFAYGRYKDGQSGKGTIVIDNFEPDAKNGGTAFPTNDLTKRWEKLLLQKY